MAVFTAETLPEGLTPAMIRRMERVDRLSKRYAIVRKRIADVMYATLPVGDYVFENVVIKRSEANVVDAKRFQETYPPEKFPQFYKLTLSVTTIPAELKSDFTEAQNKVSVTRV